MGIGALTGRAVFLDRDGVVNRAILRDGKPYSPARVEELEIPPGTSEALGRLKELGFRLLVVTNQPEVARGRQSLEALAAIHAALRRSLPLLDDVLVCIHDDGDSCACRKPRPGLILDAARRYDLDPAASYLIGDRWRDIEAGQAAGCTTIWIDYGYQERGPAKPPAAHVRSLEEAVDWIWRRERPPAPLAKPGPPEGENKP
jgi:D-glycero-D-manno-heptose 1,7-bisphosphate phosphatase